MPAGAWKLIIEDDAGKQIVVPFTREIITIGRKEGNTIRLTERNVSRNHAKLSKDNGHVLIEDLGSFNGIRLNGDRIDGRVLVHEGDTIQIGDYHLAIHAQGVAGAANGSNEHLHGATVPNLAGMAAPRSAAAASPATDDDEFAGDTQRWEPPPGMPGISVQTLPTQEDRPVQSDEPQSLNATLDTLPARLVSPEPGGGFGADNGDTERVTLDMLSSMDNMGLDSMRAGAPSRHEVELEPTVRQPAAPSGLAPPLSPLPQPAVAVLSAAATAERSAVAAERAAERQAETRPERSSPVPPTSPRTPPLANVADARQGMDEQTAAVRPSPGVADDTLPRLVVLNTIFAGSAFPLRTSEAVIGRTEDNDITIEHKSVSRNHAKIVREGDRVRILDLKSANGVLVNNEEVEAAVLRSGDVVELGRVRMRFVPIGERFTVPPDEIERARIADRAGDDFESDSGTGVTNPVRKKQAGLSASSASYDTFPVAQSRSKVALIALGVVIGLLIVVAVLVARSGKDEPKVEEPPVVGDVVKEPRIDDPPPVKPAPDEPPPPVEPPPVEVKAPADVVKPEADPPADDPRPRPRTTPRKKMSRSEMEGVIADARKLGCVNKDKWTARVKQVLAADPPQEIAKQANGLLAFCPK